MPELPEVESARRKIEKCLGQKRLAVVKADRNDRIVFDRDLPEVVEQALLGRRVLGTGRRGKYFWIEVEGGKSVTCHLGMSGDVEVQLPGQGWEGLPLQSSRRAASDVAPTPKYCRLLLVADDGTRVAVTDPRRLGRIRLASSPEQEPPISKLGPDPLSRDFPSAKKLHAILSAKRVPIKAALLDQRIFAGVGNYLADEVLYQSGIAPQRLTQRLEVAETLCLRKNLLHILKVAIRVGADAERFPKSWLFHHRWGKKRNARDSQGHAIRHDTVGGRTSAWVPAVQK